MGANKTCFWKKGNGMKSLTYIDVQGDPQQVWEVYTDDTLEQTFGFVFSEDDARLIEDMLKEARELDIAFSSSTLNAEHEPRAVASRPECGCSQSSSEGN
jgi:hypothetical protein